MQSLINKKILKRFIQIVGDQLNGDWVLLGGNVLPLLDSELRTTTDIDVAPLTPPKDNQMLKLMSIAERLKLPVESINQAASYFLYQIPEFKKNIVLYRQGKSASFYRPNLVLFIQLKIKRLSETDLTDCLEFIKLSKKTTFPAHIRALKKMVATELKNTDAPEKIKRLEILISNLEKLAAMI